MTALKAAMTGWLRQSGGAAAVEFALWAVILTAPILSVVDIGFYVYRYMQVNEAAQVAAQAAWVTCDPSKGAFLPAAKQCPTLWSVMTTAAHSTTLGANAVLQTSAEGYYCASNASPPALTLVGTAGVVSGSPLGSSNPVPPSPNNCTASTGSAAKPADYVLITVNYTYTPVFPKVTVVSLLPATISRTAWMRLSA